MDSVNNALIECIFSFSRLMKDRMSYQLGIVHLTMLQMQTLLYLQKNPSIQMRQLADYFRIELPSATNLIDTLAKIDLVQRHADEKDRRVVRIKLTQEGERLMTEAMKLRAKKIKQYLSFLSEEDKKQLLRILQKLMIKMEEKDGK